MVTGSIAAAVQSSFYGGVTGGLFSTLQSAGALAAAPAVAQVIPGVAMVAGGAAAMSRTVVRKALGAMRRN